MVIIPWKFQGLGGCARENPSSLRQKCRFRVLIRGMADAQVAGHEEHGGGHDLRHPARVVTGAAHQPPPPPPRLGAGGLDCAHQPGIHGRRGHAGAWRDGGLAAGLGGGGRHLFVQRLSRASQ